MIERVASSEELAHHPFAPRRRAGDQKRQAQIRSTCSSRSAPASRATRTARARAESWANWLFNRLSACGAIVVTGRCGQLALVSGRSNTSKNGISQVAPHEDVEAAALAIFHLRRDRPDGPFAAEPFQLRRQLGKNRGAAHRPVQAARDGQQAVADRLAVEPPPILPPEQRVLGVGRPARPVRTRRLAVGRARDDQPVHRLQAPAARDELGRQPVEQLRVRGFVAHRAEVAGGADEAPAEVVLPEPVDHHAGRQRMVGPDQPIGQRRAPAGRLRTTRRTASDHSSRGPPESRRDLGPSAPYSPRRSR